MSEETRRVLDSWKAEAESALLKRHGRDGLKPLPISTAEEFDPIAELLIATWLRWGHAGEPGLCYYSDDAMADMMALITGQEKTHVLRTRTPYYRKLRQRLQLEHACYRTPLVTSAKGVPDTGLIEIEVQFREGSHRYRLCDQQKLVIGGRQFYPLPV